MYDYKFFANIYNKYIYILHSSNSPVKVFFEVTAKEVKRYRVDAGVDKREAEAQNTVAVKVDVVFLFRF